MLIDDLRQRKKEIETLARRYGAGRIRVFGSVARREETADSDIDMLVEFPLATTCFDKDCL